MPADGAEDRGGRVLAGTAGWSVPRDRVERFPGAGTHLERYARVLHATEINSSFYRPHLPATYARWAESTPDGFRFSVKVPREITHRRKLRETDALLDAFLAESAHLGEKRGALLVQLPPSLSFDGERDAAFFAALRDRFAGNVACEPRHPTWFTSEADSLLREYRVGRVAADPAVVPEGANPGGWPGFVYYRLHGSPRIYYSAYGEAFCADIAGRLTDASARADAWCIFDNTASGAATGDALAVSAAVTCSKR
jgi:uncharacterized protein YecE (DUF72 family)